MDAPFDEPTRRGNTERYYSGRKMFGGRFVLERCLGRGGMGEVWLAADGELGREVALKFAPSEVAGDPKCVAELRREVIAGLELSHPRIARVYDLQTGDGEAAISMEYVQGKSLSDLQVESALGFFEPREIEGWIEDVKGALRYAHEEAKRTHRDVKPKNIMVDAKSGRAKLVDFGISKRISETFTRTTGTDSSGSLAYMSPQQMMGARNSAEDDWYSLGATVYELVTGAPPFFRGDVRAQIERVVPPPMGERRKELVGELIDGEGDPIPAEWEDWVGRMLSKERGRMVDAAAKMVEAPPLPEKAVVVPPEMPEQEVVKFKEKAAVVPAPQAVEERRREGEAGIFGDGAPEKVPGLRLMAKKDGFLWAGVVGVMFMVAMGATYGLNELRWSDDVLRFLVSEFVLGVLFTGWVSLVFRRQGKRLWPLPVALFGGHSVSMVVFALVMAMVQGMAEAMGNHGELVAVVVHALLHPFVLTIWLILGLRWTLGHWHWKLLVAAGVTAVVYPVIAGISADHGSYGAEPVYVVGALVVGLVFGGTSAWALVSSKKARV